MRRARPAHRPITPRPARGPRADDVSCCQWWTAAHRGPAWRDRASPSRALPLAKFELQAVLIGDTSRRLFLAGYIRRWPPRAGGVGAVRCAAEWLSSQSPVGSGAFCPLSVCRRAAPAPATAALDPAPSFPPDPPPVPGSFLVPWNPTRSPSPWTCFPDPAPSLSPGSGPRSLRSRTRVPDLGRTPGPRVPGCGPVLRSPQASSPCPGPDPVSASPPRSHGQSEAKLSPKKPPFLAPS
ncbi:uncharacterized protein [Manis javanica]|uniref:uncharacterized protein n=1 Tax=Manis javanica TaxID=9974 RepID=UPI003C6CD70E